MSRRSLRSALSTLSTVLMVAVSVAAEAPRATPPARSEARFTAKLTAGQAFEREFGPDLRLVLAPRPFGWEIVVSQKGRDENLARLTPPFHSVPNPRDLEGWHFRNADNTGPNEPGDKNINAPGEVREFIFSPAVGAAIDGASAGRSPTPDEIEEVRRWGRGTLTILDYQLADLGAGRTARFDQMRFSVVLSWPAPQ